MVLRSSQQADIADGDKRQAYSVSWGWELPPRTTMLRTMTPVGVVQLPGSEADKRNGEE
jgi:hypothetical protein